MEYSAHYEKSPRMWSQGLHAHDHYEFYVHFTGGRLYCIEDQVFELQPNQLLILPPLHMHGLICDRDLINYERSYLSLSSEMLQKCGLGEVHLPELIERAEKKNNLVKTLTQEEADLIRHNMAKIEELTSLTETGASTLIDFISTPEKMSSQEYNTSQKYNSSPKNAIASGTNPFPPRKGDLSPSQKMEIYSLIFEILRIVVRQLGEAESRPAPASDNAILAVLHYINDNFLQEIRLKDLSERFHMSESTISHRFHEYANKGIYEYVLYKRVLKAKEAMYSEASLTEIAFRCGFGDYSNFLRVFKKITGMSPREYRENMPR